MRNPTAIFILTHFYDIEVGRLFNEIKVECSGVADPYLIASDGGHNQVTDIPKSQVIVSDAESKSDLPYAPRLSGWSTPLQPGDPDLAMLIAYRALPNYDNYWLLEYDVRYTGDWGLLLTYFSTSHSDLIATNLHGEDVNLGWHHWNSLRSPASQKTKEDVAKVRGMFPFYRLSNRALRRLDQAMIEGWDGIYEVVWPTVLNAAGMQLEDFGGNGAFVKPENIDRFYTSTPEVDSLSPGTFVYRPMIRSVPRGSCNTLWHPVKRHWRNHPITNLARKLVKAS